MDYNYNIYGKAVDTKVVQRLFFFYHTDTNVNKGFLVYLYTFGLVDIETGRQICSSNIFRNISVIHGTDFLQKAM